MSIKIQICQTRLYFVRIEAQAITLRKMAHRILFQVLVGLIVLSVFFSTALLKNGIVYQIILEKIIIMYNIIYNVFVMNCKKS